MPSPGGINVAPAKTSFVGHARILLMLVLKAPHVTIAGQRFNMSGVTEDRSDHCVRFILDCMSKNSSGNAYQSPIFIGVNGVQGIGKSHLVRPSTCNKTSIPSWINCP